MSLKTSQVNMKMSTQFQNLNVFPYTVWKPNSECASPNQIPVPCDPGESSTLVHLDEEGWQVGLHRHAIIPYTMHQKRALEIEKTRYMFHKVTEGLIIAMTIEDRKFWITPNSCNTKNKKFSIRVTWLDLNTFKKMWSYILD